MAASPPPPTTVRRNPPRRGRPPPTPAGSSRKSKPPPLSRLLDEAAAASTPAAISSPLPPPPPTPPAAADAAISPIPPPPPPPTPIPTALPSSQSPDLERLKVYLRIRPLPAPERERGGKPGGRPRAKEQQQQARKPPRQAGAGAGDRVCLVATGLNSVALTVPQSKLVDSKRGRIATEVFDGLSAVLPPEASQHDIFTQVANPLVDEFLGGKSGLLVAMGPTGSGKTHTVFGTARNPGIVPLTLQKIFSATDQNDSGTQPTRSFCLSMFEILCEGKAERIVDLLSEASDLVLQQSTIIKGLEEVAVPNCMDAETLVSRGMLRRSTAATNANSESSRSQCIITIRAMHKNNDRQSEHPLAGSVLTIADLAGAERKNSTGNMGSRLLESNFINNTSMVFGNCLRALLDHQKNPKKTLEKHFKNSMLTRYLKDYLEGRKKMTLILNVKPGDDDYSDTSYLLRQASPYMKIRYTSLDESSDLASQKRSSVSLICQENKKKRKVQKPEVLKAEGNDNIDKSDDTKLSERVDFLDSELQRVSRSEEIMKNLFRALWAFSKQKLLESEIAAKSMRELLSEKDIQIIELKKELSHLKSCSREKFSVAQDTHVEQNDAISLGQAALRSASQYNQTDPGSSDVELDDFHLSTELVAEEVPEESACSDPERSSAYCDTQGKSVGDDTSSTNAIDEQEPSSRYLKITGQVVNNELYSSERCSLQTSAQRIRSNIEEESIPHELDVKEMKHRDWPSSSQEANPDTEAVSSSQAFAEFQGMGGVEKNPEEPVSASGRCGPNRDKHVSAVGSPRLDGVKGHADMSRHALHEGPLQTKASAAPTEDHHQAAEATADEKENRPVEGTAAADKKEKHQAGGSTRDDKKEEDLCASKPSQKTKKARRRLLPASAMTLREFTGPAIDAAADTKRATADAGALKSSLSAGVGRSEKLIRLLKARPATKLH